MHTSQIKTFILKKRNYIVALLVLLFLDITLVHNSSLHKLGIQDTEPAFINSDTVWVDSVYKAMNWDERIGQLFMVAAYSDRGKDHQAYIAKLIKDYNIGGLIFFQGGPRRQIELTNYYQKLSKVPLLIGIDGEWGLGMRLDSTISYPKQIMMGALQDNNLIYQFGKQLAEQCHRIGVHINFAPVIDVNNNSKNPVINYRSFGQWVDNVSMKGLYYMKGMQDNNLLCTGKHFPGHGDTEVDSHYDLPKINHNRHHLDSIELAPFKKLIDHGLSGVMVAHLSIPSLDQTPNLPSTLSVNIIDSLLKRDLQFKGLIFTDALNMQGASKYCKPGVIDVLAIRAGNDVLLYPASVPVALKTIKKAIRQGKIDTVRIEQSCKKILLAKKWMNLDTLKPINTENLYNDLHKKEYQVLKNKIVKNSITLVKNDNNLLPLKRLDTLKIASISFGKGSNHLHQEFLSKYTSVSHFSIDNQTSVNEIEQVREYLKKYNLLILSIYSNSRKASDNYGISEKYLQVINSFSREKKVVLNLLANPYSLEFWKGNSSFSSILIGYYPSPESEQYTTEAIFGGIGCRGKLPVSAGDYIYGTGLKTKKNRLSRGLPEEENVNGDILLKIDSIAKLAVREQATPGCQVLVSKNGVVIYEKAFGYHTYDKKEPVELSHLYDLASITKITATAPVLMKLSDEQRFNVDSSLQYYLPELDTTNKGPLNIKDILTHQARLKPWIPFYLSLIEGYDTDEKIMSRTFSKAYPNKVGNVAYLIKGYKFRDSILSPVKTDTFSYQVADNLYISKFYEDSIFSRIRSSELQEEKKYLYSDLGYYYFKEIIEKITKKPIEEYVQDAFYKKLGASTLGYKPLERFPKSEIVPTEDDKIFRKQLVHGYVHDPGAAMLDQVGGHAGLFSNANDLAKMMQMYLQFGEYGGERYLSSTILQQFTTCQFCPDNRRGIAFDKADPDTAKVLSVSKSVSPASFGHSGFTGTMAWVDPEYNLIYIFLSNRINPDAENKQIYRLNIRPSIHDVIYQALEN